MRKIGVALVTVLLAASACGGSGSSRPTVAELSQSLQGGNAAGLMNLPASLVTPKVADCMARVVVDSKLSDKAVIALRDGDKSFSGDAADSKLVTDLATKLGACATAAAGQ